MNATSRFAPSASSPWSVDEPSASTAPASTLSPWRTIGRWWISVPWFERMNFVRSYSSRVPLALDHDAGGVEVDDGAGVLRDDDVAGVDGGAVLDAGADERRLRDHQRHGLPLHVRAHQRAVGVVVLEERDHRGRDRDDLRRRDVHEVDVLGERDHGLALGRAAEHLVVLELAALVDALRGLRDRVLRLLGGVEIDDLVGHLAVRRPCGTASG